MILVDNNVLSSLAKIDRLDLLSTHFDTVATTTGVVEERNRDAVSGYDFVDRIDRVKRYHGGWLCVFSPTEVELRRAEELLDETLSFTDAECIAIARTRELALLTDDNHVGEMAAQHDVEEIAAEIDRRDRSPSDRARDEGPRRGGTSLRVATEQSVK